MVRHAILNSLKLCLKKKYIFTITNFQVVTKSIVQEVKPQKFRE